VFFTNDYRLVSNALMAGGKAIHSQAVFFRSIGFHQFKGAHTFFKFARVF
jgi:hypothetical protein